MKVKTCKKCGEHYEGERCKPCLKARMANRYAQNKERQREKSAVWRAANPEKVRVSAASYRTRNHEKVLAAMSAWREANPEGHRAWRQVNAERMRELHAAWWKSHPGAAGAYYANRRAQKQKATPLWFGDFDEFAVREAYHLAKLREKATGLKWHVDHIVPLMGKRVCGLHVAANLAVIPATLNLRKSNRFSCGEEA